MTRRIRLLLMCAVIGLLPFTQTAAQEKLPTAMKGRWIGMGQQGGKIPIDFPWSIEITKQNPDGSIEGSMNYAGPQCSAKNAPMTGTFDGVDLIVTTELQPKMQCGKQSFRLKKSGGKHLFEGKGQNRAGYLDPS
jgi:hypothetical protein